MKKRKYTPDEIEKFKKTGRKSSRKGKRRERIFAKMLSAWWTSGKDTGAFRRTPQSGGFPKKRSHGDICPVSEAAAFFPFIVDIKDRKNVEDLEFVDLLSNEGNPLFKWWAELTQIIQDNPALHSGKMRLLVVHKSRKDYCVVGLKEYDYITSNAGHIPHIKVSHPFRYEPLIVFPLTALFDKDPETLKTIKEEYVHS